METTVKGQNYRSGRLSAMQQFHVARRVAPALTGLVSAFGAIKQDAAAGGAEQDAAAAREEFAKAVGPLANAIAQMSDADAEYVLGTCLAVVSRQTDPTTWAPVWREGRLVFDDIDLSTMIQLAAKVIQDNLGNIFGALPAKLPA
ncbi:phage tail assembly chaperone [Bordetella bronchialis]|uniref:phage tail assembly chaperone n=1 Tax=Bordetella bronchialis TaxID=463025 RepID=UPI003CFC0FFE